MATHKSAEKRIRQTKRRTDVNQARLSRFRSSVRKVEDAITKGDKKAAEAAMRVAEPELVKSAAKGLIHRNTATRKISRLVQRIKSMSA